MAKSRSRVVVGVEAAFLAVAAGLLILLLVSPSFLAKVHAVVFPMGPAPETQAGTRAAPGSAIAGKLPAFMTVPPGEMFAAFAGQYRMRPDSRIVMSFETLARRREQSRGEETGGRYAAGAARAEEGKTVIPLLRDGAVIRETILPVPASFAQALSLLDEWAVAMDDAASAPGAASPFAAAPTRKIEEAIGLIDMVDPRYVAAGLTLLERLGRDGARDARVLRAAARGYATLLMVLEPDEMQLADPFAAEALAFLALARRADPKLSLAREEALLAMAMGYRAHAAGLLKDVPARLRRPADKILDAYLRQDLASLRRARESEPGVLGAYLLARHYREVGLGGEAKDAARALFEGWPTLYPSVVETIQSGDLGEGKLLTILYPHQIAEQVKVLVDPAALKGLPSWIMLAKRVIGGEVMPLAEFQGILDRWKPYGDDNSVRFIVDADRVKRIFRCAYADAVHFRFDLLFRRWAVRDAARDYASSLAASDNTHPLVMSMRGNVAADSGDAGAADRLFAKVLLRGDSGGPLAYSVYSELSDPLAKIRLRPAAFGCMDGRPRNVLLAGWILADAYNYDLAARFYSAGLAADPYAFWAYHGLATVRGTDAPLREALESQPGSYELLAVAGDYFTGKNDASSRAIGERAFAAAQSLAPSVGAVAEKRAKALSDLGRHQEAIGVLDAWIERYGDDGLETVIMNARRARAHLKTGQPRDALRVLGSDAESMQGTALAVAAEIHEALGDFAAAERYHRTGVERYPTSGPTLAGAAEFFWRRGNCEAAAEMIARGRPSRKPTDHWYYNQFLAVFRDAPQDRIVRAIDALKAGGAMSDEILPLASGLHDAGRSEAAFSVASGLRGQQLAPDVQVAVDAYRILREWKGREAASAYLRKRVSETGRILAVSILYNRTMYDAVLEEMGDPDAFPAPHREFMWLQKLLAWLMTDRKPAELAGAFEAHYQAPTSDKYHTTGRYMLGMISRDDLVGTIRAAKDRCEFAYYIGFSERLKGNFAEATQWYQLCLETLLATNGEFHWAGEELFWWGHMGIENRHRLASEDVAERRKARMRDVSGRPVM